MKTASEEAAAFLSGYATSNERAMHPVAASEARVLSARLRAEGRELKRLRKLIVESDATSGWWSTEEMAERGVKVMDALQREAARIQKARKAK